MIHKYKIVSIIYGGSGKKYAEILNNRIEDFAEKERFPLSSKIIIESILTRELLSDVTDLFKKSEFCVALLTADDCYSVDSKKRYRLRQNIIFELGMALIQLGRERCIILSDFDINDKNFELPTDMNSLEIKQFDPDNFNNIIDDVIIKLLNFSKTSLITGYRFETAPQYNKLLTRSNYYVDYGNLFNDYDQKLSSQNPNYFTNILSHWYDECAALPHYDEKCIYLLERLGFIPIWGRIPEVQDFMMNSLMLVENYNQSDIDYYGNTEILNFTKNLIDNIIEYTRIKTANNEINLNLYEKLLDNFLFDDIPKDTEINPLLLLTYYDYIGLTYLRLYGLKKDPSNLSSAQAAFIKSLKYVKLVDMSLQVWSGFLTYNLARTYMEQKNIESAIKYYKKAIHIRAHWLKHSNFNVITRNALSYEYFVAKINYIDMFNQYSILSHNEIQQEYINIEAELNTYSDIGEKMNQLILIRKMLSNRINK